MTNENEFEFEELEDDVDDAELDDAEDEPADDDPADEPKLDFSRARPVGHSLSVGSPELSSFSDVIEGIENFDPASPSGSVIHSGFTTYRRILEESLGFRSRGAAPTDSEIVAAVARKALSIRAGDDFLCHFWEPEIETRPADFEKAKIKARDILWPNVDRNRPRYFLQACWFIHLTDYGKEVLRDFNALVSKILAAPSGNLEPKLDPFKY